MTSPGKQPGSISAFSRVLAWVYVVCSVLGVAGWIFSIAKSKATLDGTAISYLLLILLVSPLFWYAAFTGRSPQWLSSIDTAYDREAERQGMSAEASKPGRILMYVVAAVVFVGTLLFVFWRSP